MTQTITPDFADESINRLLQQHFALAGQLKVLPGEFDQNRLLATESGEQYIVKILSGVEALPRLEMQNAAMAFLTSKGFAVPCAIAGKEGREITRVRDDEGNEFLLRLLAYVPGHFYADVAAARHTPELWRDLGGFLAGLDNALGEFEFADIGQLHKWDLANAYAKCQNEKHLLAVEQVALLDHFLEHYRLQVLPHIANLPRSFIHNDANDHNILVDDEENPTRIIGLIDFGDMVYSHTINELAIAAAYALMGQNDPIETLTCLIASYHEVRPLSDAEIEVLFGLTALRICTSVCNAATEYRERPDNTYLQISAKPAWELLERLRKLSPFAVECQLRIACGLNPDKGRSSEEIIGVRRRHLGKTLSLCYREPLKIASGQGAYLYDEQGNAYLDMVNNVCHVGHCHPRVVAAGQAQMARINTNTRFLHDNLVDYSEKLLATMPEQLSVCMFVNSGSEANELAFRLARNYSGSRELLVVDGAYHGNTSACIEASPYKFEGPGGEGAADHVHKVMLPDPYRGQFQGMDQTAALGYAADVERAITELADRGLKPGAFICESLQGVAGQIIMPDGYLQAVYSIVRNAGGVCIADEVQVGFGRVGSHMWAFETQGVVPDIVTLGKPIGNGHPMAAVITTQEIADAFVTGMEYFNTFGGNPVSCAIGMAVLDVIRDEQLQQNARDTGSYLQAELRQLQQEFELIGDVRGLGLFIGVELVTDHTTRQPATEQTSRIIEFMKEQRIILSTEGAFANVLKIKPPIVFDRDDADRFVSVLRSGLAAVESKVSTYASTQTA